MATFTIPLLVAALLILVALLVWQRHLLLRARSSSRRPSSTEDATRNPPTVVTRVDRERDGITGLLNRLAIQVQLGKRVEQAGQPFAVLHLGLDGFRHVNERHGHVAGDRVLRTIADRLRSNAWKEHIIARLGNDEFCVIVPSMSDTTAVRSLAQHLHTLVSEAIDLEDERVTVNTSIGIALYPLHGASANDLFNRAERALREAKEQGPGSHRIYQEPREAGLSADHELEQALRAAIDTDQIFLEYQPIVDLRSGVLASFEALARWRHPQLGLIPAERFVTLAQQAGLIVALGERVLREVIVQLQRWQNEHVPLATVAVNVAATQLERTNFPILAHELALKHDVDPRWLAFELTESEWVRDSERHIVSIDTLRHAGSSVCIDDFGAGFSNLNYLRRLPVDVVKVDRSFITHIATDAADATILSGVIAMARARGIKVVAEGIETIEQLDAVRALGCDRGQGYYFGKPAQARYCRALLEQMGHARRLTETVKLRALRIVETADPAAE